MNPSTHQSGKGFGLNNAESQNSIALCQFCDKFRDIDLLYTPRMGLNHHAGYAELVRSAEEGCVMCKALLRAWKLGQEPAEYRKSRLEFEKEVTSGDTRITWRRNGDTGDIFFLTQHERLGSHHEPLHVWMELFTDKDNAMASIIKGRPCRKRSDSDACFELLSRWVEECKSKHTYCSWEDDRRLPSRVIEVGSISGINDPYLFISDGRRGSWVTLSHCWGGKLPIATKSDTIKYRQKVIQMEELPPTFQDAVMLTRKLGFQYLWIDSLCIIQDCREDWEAEAAVMHEIYSGASINLSASAARTAQDGIFITSNQHRHYMEPFLTLPCYSTIHQIQGPVSFRLPFECFPDSALQVEPLHKRAWVLQESILSPRRVDFASCQIHWNCRTSSLSEGWPDESRDYITTLASGKDLFQMPIGKHESNPALERIGTYHKPMSWWYQTLGSYCTRGITIHEDLLPAIAGVAKKIEERTGYHYIAGLWLEDLHRGLLWQSNGTILRPTLTSAPSWTWASTNIPWQHGWRHLFLDVYKPDFGVKILHIGATTASSDPFAQVASSSLKLYGYWRSLDFWKADLVPVYNKTARMRLFNRWLSPVQLGNDEVVPLGRVLCTMDVRSDSETCHSELVMRNLICMQIAKFEHREPWFDHEGFVTVYALILEPTGMRTDEYKRVGIAEIPEDDGMANGWDTRVIDVV